jgi:hypothetical protein
MSLSKGSSLAISAKKLIPRKEFFVEVSGNQDATALAW